jgi:glycosyltransferase involved in cell wall biosynthesis
MSARAHVSLLLEGTYPYVRGGVSSWVHQLITGLPELRFSLVFIGGRRVDYGEARYELPQNVVTVDRFYLEDAFAAGKPGPARAPAARFADADALHQLLKLDASGQACPRSRRSELQGASDRVLDRMEGELGLRVDDFLSSPASWEQIRTAHRERDPHAAFVDYFWTVRLMHGPLFQLARIERQLPDAGVFHAISTGYAGFLGSLLQRRRQRPLLLSEHGIYTKERRIDLNQADWFDTLHANATGPDIGTSTGLRELWIRHFESLGRLTYRSANPIISLYAGNRERQVRDGADPERTRLIVNGIDCARFAGALAARPAQVPKVVGMIGRVVPIKDVKTFIRTMQRVIAKLPDVEGWVIGSAEEDPRYGAECEALAASLGLAGKVRFLGHQNVQDMLPRLGLLMLTSISEAQPLAILEAFAAGVPCVATDVGACREEIEGGHAEDRALGKAGRIAPFADADALAAAAVELLSSPEIWHACQAAGIARVGRYYTQERMLGAYRGLYRKLLRG